MARSAKRRRLTRNGTPPLSPPTQLDRVTWPGWCEIESEPAFFNVMLDDMGVKGVKIREVMGLDDDLLAILPKPIHALIFLFRYREVDKDKLDPACPDHVWFANQVPDFSCATVAMLNILNNVPSLDIGPHLQSFKDFTQHFEPLERGYAIDSFEFVKRIHNSFARETDMLNADLCLKNKHDKMIAKEKADAAKATRVAKAAEKAAQAESKGGVTRRSTRQPKPCQKPSEPTLEEEAEDGGFHFVAYVPIHGEVWKLDGLDRFPQNLGKPEHGSDWLSVAVLALQLRMAQYEAGQVEFNLMALVHDPLVDARQSMAENITALAATEKALDSSTSEWRVDGSATTDGPTAEKELVTGISLDYGISFADLDVALSESVSQRLQSGDIAQLKNMRRELVLTQSGLRATIRDELQGIEADQQKAMLRRHDLRPFLQGWLEGLQEQDVFDTLVAKVKADA